MGDRDRPIIMNIQETADYLRTPVSSAYRLAQDGRIPGRKVGRHWRFHRDALDQWLGAQSKQRGVSA